MPPARKKTWHGPQVESASGAKTFSTAYPDYQPRFGVKEGSHSSLRGHANATIHMHHPQGHVPAMPNLGQRPVPMRPMAPVVNKSNEVSYMARRGAMPGGMGNGARRGSKPVRQLRIKTTHRQRNDSNRDAQVKRKGPGRGEFQKNSKRVMVSGRKSGKASPAQQGKEATNAVAECRLRIPKWPYAGMTCIDREEIAQRYGSKLVLPEDFVQMTHCWNKNTKKVAFEQVGVKQQLCQLIDINRSIPTHHEVKIKDMKRPNFGFFKDGGESSPDAVTSRYVSKVILCAGLNQEQKIAALSVPGEADNEGSEWDHLSKLLKFVCARREVDGEKSGIFALGGMVSQVHDGVVGSQDVEDSPVMRRAAMRHVKDQTGIDLSDCKEWIPFVKLNYLRPCVNVKGFEEIVTVLFVVLDADQAVPGGLRAPIDDPKWQHAWETRHDERQYSEVEDLGKPSTQEEEYEDGELNMDEIKREELAAEAAKIPCPTPRLLFMGAHTENVKLKTMPLSLDGLLDYNETDTGNETFELSIFAEAFHEMLSRDAGDIVLKVLMNCANVQKIGMLACVNDTDIASNASEESLSIGEYSSDRSLNSGDEEPVENELALLAFGYFDVSGRGYLTIDDARKILTRLGRGLHKQTLDDMLDKLAVKGDGVARLYYHDLLE